MPITQIKIQPVEWVKEKTSRTAEGYQFYLTISDVPDPMWIDVFEQESKALRINAYIHIPLDFEHDKFYAVVTGNPSSFETYLYPKLKEAMQLANDRYNQEVEEHSQRRNQRQTNQAQEDRALAELKNKFKAN